MATSSGVLQSFLRDALNDGQKFDDLRVKDLLEYNRTACALIRMTGEPTAEHFDDIDYVLKENKALPDSNAVIRYKDKLYYADKKKRSVKELLPDESNQEAFTKLLKKFPKVYKQAKGNDLDLVMSATGRAFSEHRSNDFTLSLNFYLGILAKADKVMFKYMKEEDQNQLRFDLKTTLLLLVAQQQHEIDYQKTENKILYNQHIRRCMELLRALDLEYQKFIQQNPEQAEIHDAMPLKYTGIELGRMLGKEIDDWTNHPSKEIDDWTNHPSKSTKKAVGFANERRLYWVWASTFLKTTLGLIPLDPRQAERASGALQAPDPYTGCLSWAIYYGRGALEGYFLYKHTYQGQWMSEEEAKTPSDERFLTQWDQRKFSLLNDSIWGIANMLCYFWLNGKNGLGTPGDVVTIALLAFDIAITIWDFAEQKTKYNKQILQYDEDLKRLHAAIEKLKAEMEKDKDDEEVRKKSSQIQQMEWQINALEREKDECERDWQFQKLSLINNISYAVGLLLAFTLLTLPFIPVVGQAAATLMLVGAVLCLAFTIINSVIKDGLELWKTHETQKDIKKLYDKKVAMFREDKTLTDDQRKLLYLEIQKLKAETVYQKEMFSYQMMNLVSNVLLKIVCPAIILASSVFLGNFVLGAVLAFALAVAAHKVIDSYKPKGVDDLAPFDEEKYNSFCKSIDAPEENNEPKATKKAKTLFFASSSVADKDQSKNLLDRGLSAEDSLDLSFIKQ
jgi:hypothetical protein